MSLMRLPLVMLFTALSCGAGFALEPPRARTAEAVFAGGCFWTVEAGFEKLPGVIEAVSGYTGGRTATPVYNDVVGGRSGHYEAVKVTYDPDRLSYGKLAETFFHMIDPVQTDGQVCDIGTNYRTAIFATPAQKPAAENAKDVAGATLSQPIATQILPLGVFTAAEEEHQNFWKTNAAHYNAYRKGCGRDARLVKLWGDMAWPGAAH